MQQPKMIYNENLDEQNLPHHFKSQPHGLGYLFMFKILKAFTFTR